jgi:hypothetical protein
VKTREQHGMVPAHRRPIGARTTKINIPTAQAPQERFLTTGFLTYIQKADGTHRVVLLVDVVPEEDAPLAADGAPGVSAVKVDAALESVGSAGIPGNTTPPTPLSTTVAARRGCGPDSARPDRPLPATRFRFGAILDMAPWVCPTEPGSWSELLRPARSDIVHHHGDHVSPWSARWTARRW